MSVICVALVLAALVSAAVIFFKIGSIVVVGESVYNDEEIIEASGVKIGQSMFMFNKFASISNIFADCPYIDTIQMKRTLPDVIQIIVTPCEPIGVVQHGTSNYIIDINGKVLEATTPSGVPENLPIIVGGEPKTAEVGKNIAFSEEETTKALFSVLNTAKNNDILKNIGSIDVTKAFNVHFEYMGRFTVKIGTSEDIERKFKFLGAVVDALGTHERGTIDVSDGTTGYFTQD